VTKKEIIEKTYFYSHPYKKLILNILMAAFDPKNSKKYLETISKLPVE
jgi:hypothetical protein